MFYSTKTGQSQAHGLPHNPFKAIIAPRPIGWISTRSTVGDNLAPYSFFNAVADNPPQVIFASDGMKDTATAAKESGVFCVNFVTQSLLSSMNASSANVAQKIDEFVLSGLEKAECETINCPRVTASPAAMECQVLDIITLKGGGDFMILGEVNGIHIAPWALSNGRYDVVKIGTIARMGYKDYSLISAIFELERPR
ncbi:MAG: flavin reductase (DIM6/NTAB) family NADH-FMN oxidoreductase RutF [Paracoccaceae bacterium]|jgi:flavin reductase (DIM6/NTAB) family NADH-FMN oxidoreductase RutF